MEQNWNEFKGIFSDILMDERFSDSLLTKRFLEIKNKLRAEGKYSFYLHRFFGHSYTISEVAYHMLGGKDEGWKSMHLNHLGCSHWFLKHDSGFILDLTRDHFNVEPDYDIAKSKGFMTKKPCDRTKKLMKLILYKIKFMKKLSPISEEDLDRKISDIIMTEVEAAPKKLEKLGIEDVIDISSKDYLIRSSNERLYSSY